MIIIVDCSSALRVAPDEAMVLETVARWSNSVSAVRLVAVVRPGMHPPPVYETVLAPAPVEASAALVRLASAAGWPVEDAVLVADEDSLMVLAANVLGIPVVEPSEVLSWETEHDRRDAR